MSEADTDPGTTRKFFELGLMGIEVPERFGGAGGTIFLAVHAIAELAPVDASAVVAARVPAPEPMLSVFEVIVATLPVCGLCLFRRMERSFADVI